MSPSRIAARVRRIKPSPSTSAADRANELRRQGKSIVNLVVGEPDFDTPAHIRQAAADAMDKGATRYTLMAGTVELRQAIAAKLERENGLHYALNEIIATNGAKSAIYSALATTLEPGDEVIIPAPYWVSYPDMVLACDGVPVIVACPEANGFKLTPAQLEAAITPKTRWLLINSPSNPDRRQLHRGRVPRAGRRARAPSARARDDRRHLRAHPLRRPAARRICCTPRPSCATARWRSTASPRPTR